LLDQRTAEDDLVNEDRGLGAMPKLYGAPAYARPPVAPASPVDRPQDPDDQPLESVRGSEDLEPVGQDFEPAGQLQPRSYEAVATVEPPLPANEASTKLHGRPLRMRIPGRNSNGR
jgi:hypothetical protein